MKKLFLVLLAMFTLFFIAACQRGIRIDFLVDGDRYEQLRLDEAGRLPTVFRPEKEGYFFLGWYHDEEFNERFDYLAEVEDDMTLYAKFIEDDGELNTYLTDNLAIPAHEGKSFFDDGIGEVELLACRDGDTADFTDGEKDFRVRFLGIDTPESGHFYEPWGPAASAYACEVKANAETIVLERDEAAGNRGTYGRELAYVWVDGRLLNLELIELAYTPATGVGELQYGFDLRLAEEKAALTNRRLHSEDDPDHDYREAIDTTIGAIVEDPQAHMTTRVNVEGVVTARVGQHAFLEDFEGEAGIFFYVGYATTNRLQVGFHVAIENAQVYHDGKPFDDLFLTNFGNASVDVRDEDVEYTVHTTPFAELGFAETGLRFAYSGVRVTAIDEEGFHFVIEDGEGNTMNVHQLFEPPLLNDAQHSLMPMVHRLDSDALTSGQEIDILVNLSEIDGELVFVLAHKDDVLPRD